MPSTSQRPTLSDRQQQCLDTIVAAVPPLLIEAYGERLLAVVLFGSVARGTAGPSSDSDWLVVLRERGSQLREDHRGCARALAALQPRLNEAHSLGINGEPQFHLRSAVEAEQGGPFFLDLCHDGRILHDPDGWATDFLARYRQRLRDQGSVRVPWGDGWYWRLTPEVRPAAEVWF